MGLKAIFFDLDDTLVLTSEADAKACLAVCELAKELLPAIDTVRLLDDWRVRFVASPWDPAMQVPVAQWRAAHWQGALADQGLGRGQAGLGAALHERWDSVRMALFRFEPGVEELLAAVRAAGLKAVIITNGHAQIQRQKLRQCGAAARFDGCLVGGEEVAAGRAEKPAASIFLAACRIAGCEPHEAIHIGDSLLADIAGGNGAGLRATVWVNAKGAPLPPDAPQPSHTVSHVTQLQPLLAQLLA